MYVTRVTLSASVCAELKSVLNTFLKLILLFERFAQKRGKKNYFNNNIVSGKGRQTLKTNKKR